ncbi:MAG: precorrin-2 C(20)-methyltransferase [Acidimicrobiales bacterium]|nr:MAG: precorrin-2 C(20)-methyltransferase [Acidimicrobiales bacterium]
MRKTTVYLPDHLKSGLEQLARASGRSEAQLIRLAVSRLLKSESRLLGGTLQDEVPRSEDATRERSGPATLVGVGVGPGPADLLTLRAVEVLKSVEVVAAPVTSERAVGRAESIVRQVLPDLFVHRLPFVMEPKSDERTAAIHRAARWITERLDEGCSVAFITLGDPNVYSTFTRVREQVERMRPLTPVTTVPGIMAFQDLAAKAGCVLVEGRESLRLVCGPFGGADSVPRADPDEALVVYKGGEHLPEIAHAVGERRRGGGVVGELLGMPGERVVPLERAEGRASYLTTVIVPPERGAPSGDMDGGHG